MAFNDITKLIKDVQAVIAGDEGVQGQEREKIEQSLAEIVAEFRAEKKKKDTRKTVVVIGVVVIAVLTALLIGRFWQDNAAYERAKEALTQNSSKITIVDDNEDNEKFELSITTVKETLAPASELTTTKYYYTDTDTYENTGKIKLPFNTEKLIFTYDGCVNIGIAFDEVAFDIDNRNKIIYVSLPELKCLSHELDHDSMEVYEEKHAVFRKMDMKDYTDLLATAKAKTEEKVMSNEYFMEDALENTKNVIASFLTSAVATHDYSVRFTDETT